MEGKGREKKRSETKKGNGREGSGWKRKEAADKRTEEK